MGCIQKIPKTKEEIKQHDVIIISDVDAENGKRRVMTFTSDPCPHWGMNFMAWEYYPKFWIQAIKWLARKI